MTPAKLYRVRRTGWMSQMAKDLKCLVQKESKGPAGMQIEEVPLSVEALDGKDVFILDALSKIYVWCGSRSSLSAFTAAMAFAEGKRKERGAFDVSVTTDLDDDFWCRVQSATMEMTEISHKPKLYLVSREGDKSYLRGFLKEMPLTHKSLDPQEVFVLDSGRTLYVWVGENASECQKTNADLYANSVVSKRGASTTVVTHDVDDAFWELLGSNSSICKAEFNCNLGTSTIIKPAQYPATVSMSLPPFSLKRHLMTPETKRIISEMDEWLQTFTEDSLPGVEVLPQAAVVA